MPLKSSNAWQRLVLATGALVSCGAFGAAGVRAQGLDMDAGPTAAAPPAATASHQSDGLDIDAHPGTPAATVVQRPAPEPVILDHPTVVDTAKLQSGQTTVSLYGIEGMDGASAQGLQGFLGGGGRVTCLEHAGAGFVCLMADGTDVAQVGLVNGAAKTTQDAPVPYREQEAAAQAARRGVWANLPPPPETLRHPAVSDTATLLANGKTYRLDGVAGFQAPYANQLQAYIAANGDSATCAPQNDAGHFVCLLPDGAYVAKVALVNGAARVAQDAPDAYRLQQLDALNNRRGYWATAPEAVMTAALLPPGPGEQYTLVAGDDGVDGVAYVGGAPVALIGGKSVFLVYGDNNLGWGYYDHYHHWRGAPDRYRYHMERYHPGGHGLRGYDGFHHDAALHGREEAMRHDPGRAGGFRPGTGGREEAMHAGAGRPGPGGTAPHPANMAMAAGRPATTATAAHPGTMATPGHSGTMAATAGHPGTMAAAGGQPGAARGAPGGGFMRPNPAASAGGYHPGAAPAVHTAAVAPHPPAPHPSSGGSGSAKHK